MVEKLDILANHVEKKIMEQTVKKIPLAKNAHWLTKNLKEFAVHPINFLLKQKAEYGDIVELDMCIAKTYLLSKPEYVKYVLQDNNKNYKKSLAYEIALKLLLGNGLVTSEGDFWRKQRRMAQPAFHKKRLEGFVDIMVDSTKQLINRFEYYAKTNETFDAQVEMTAVTAEIVARALFSSDVTGLVEKVNESISELNEFAVDRLQSIIRIPTWIPTPRNKKLNHHLDFIKNMIGEIIDKRKATNETKDDLLSMLIEAKDEETGESMSRQQLIDECVTLFIAGNETSSMALSWCMIILEQNPAAKSKIRQEYKTVIGNTDITPEKTMQLTYTLKVIKETMRIYPPVWVIGRKPITNDTIDGFELKSANNILLSIYNIHHSEKYWDEPQSFKPERFEKENMKKKHKYAYMPFGGGPRLCIGNNFALMEMQIILAMLLSKFEIKPQYDKTPELEPLITLRPKGGVPVKVEQINH